MATATTPTSELDAVNLMLSAIGESPVNSLTNSPSADVALARNTLSEINRYVQSMGWHFNTEINFPLTPDITTGKIAVPSTVMRIDTTGNSRFIDVVQRGDYLYNREDHTFVFTDTIYVEMILLLPFDDLPEAARYYIATTAARIFANRVVGSPSLSSFTDEDRKAARACMEAAEADTGDYNMLTGSYSVGRIIQRWGPRR